VSSFTNLYSSNAFFNTVSTPSIVNVSTIRMKIISISPVLHLYMATRRLSNAGQFKRVREYDYNPPSAVGAGGVEFAALCEGSKRWGDYYK
jgi:hypothetical protein